jgi:hypothetical protein
MKIDGLLKQYPKKRPPLSKKLKKIFNRHYLENRQSILSQLSEQWLHRSIKKSKKKTSRTLEVGAGTLNHLRYGYTKNIIYDIIEPKKFLFKNSDDLKKINKIFTNIHSCKSNSYDRIISSAVLEHIEDLPDFLTTSSLKMKKLSFQSHSIPCEGYPMWNLTWTLFSGILFRLKTGCSFKEVQKHEHLNTLDEILTLIKYFYNNVSIKYSYPFYNKYMSFYANITFSNPNTKSIKLFIKKYKQKNSK